MGLRPWIAAALVSATAGLALAAAAVAAAVAIATPAWSTLEAPVSDGAGRPRSAASLSLGLLRWRLEDGSGAAEGSLAAMCAGDGPAQRHSFGSLPLQTLDPALLAASRARCERAVPAGRAAFALFVLAASLDGLALAGLAFLAAGGRRLFLGRHAWAALAALAALAAALAAAAIVAWGAGVHAAFVEMADIESGPRPTLGWSAQAAIAASALGLLAAALCAALRPFAGEGPVAIGAPSEAGSEGKGDPEAPYEIGPGAAACAAGRSPALVVRDVRVGGGGGDPAVDLRFE